MEQRMGLVLGLFTGILVGLLILAMLFKNKVLDLTFDERQERARGEAYKYGFWTLLLCLLLYGFSDMALGRWCDAITGVMLCLAPALLVFAIVCITKDAYLSLKEKPRSVMTLLTVVTLMNLAVGGGHLALGDLVENGILTYRAVNLICGVMCAVLLAVYLVNYLLGKNEEAE